MVVLRDSEEPVTKSRFRPEQIIQLLQEAQAEIGKGLTVREVCHKMGIRVPTYYHWRRVYDGLRVDQTRQPGELELENHRLRKLVAELMLDKQILTEALKAKS